MEPRAGAGRLDAELLEHLGPRGRVAVLVLVLRLRVRLVLHGAVVLVGGRHVVTPEEAA